MIHPPPNQVRNQVRTPHRASQVRTRYDRYGSSKTAGHAGTRPRTTRTRPSRYAPSPPLKGEGAYATPLESLQMIPSRGHVAVYVQCVTGREHSYPIVAWSADGEPVIVGRRGLITITIEKRYPEGWIFDRIEQGSR